MDTLNLMASLSGLVSSILVPILFMICWNRNNYSIKKNTLSDCGSSSTSSKLFTFTLALFGILEIYFTYSIVRNLLPPSNIWIMIPAFVAGFLTIMVAVFDDIRFPGLHKFFAYAIFGLLILWCLALHLLIFQHYFIPGFVGIVLSVILGIGVAVTKRIYGNCAIPEIFFIVGVIIWNLYFSWVILIR